MAVLNPYDHKSLEVFVIAFERGQHSLTLSKNIRAFSNLFGLPHVWSAKNARSIIGKVMNTNLSGDSEIPTRSFVVLTGGQQNVIGRTTFYLCWFLVSSHSNGSALIGMSSERFFQITRWHHLSRLLRFSILDMSVLVVAHSSAPTYVVDLFGVVNPMVRLIFCQIKNFLTLSPLTQSLTTNFNLEATRKFWSFQDSTWPNLVAQKVTSFTKETFHIATEPKLVRCWFFEKKFWEVLILAVMLFVQWTIRVVWGLSMYHERYSARLVISIYRRRLWICLEIHPTLWVSLRQSQSHLLVYGNRKPQNDYLYSIYLTFFVFTLSNSCLQKGNMESHLVCFISLEVISQL